MSEPVLEIAGSTQTCINMPQPLPIPVQKTKLKEDVDKTYIYDKSCYPINKVVAEKSGYMDCLNPPPSFLD